MSNFIRLAWNNGVTRDAASIVASSEQSSNPADSVKDPAPWIRWRSKIGWTVVLNESDKIEVRETGISFVGVGTRAKVASGNMTPGEPAGVLQNDILVAIIEQKDNVAATMSGDWTSVYAVNNGATSRATAFWARRGASAPDFTVTRAAGDAGIACVLAFRGCVLSGSPLDVAAGTSNTPGASAVVTAPSVTTVTNGCMILLAGHAADDGTAPVFSGSEPPVEQVDDNTDLGLDCGIFADTFVQAAAGATTARTATYSLTELHIGGTIALKPETGGINRTATIAAGYYATGSAYATAAQTALNSMGGASGYTVTYSSSKFTIANATLTALNLIGGSSQIDRWALPDMGFLDSASNTGLLSYTGDVPAHKGREALMLDLGADSFIVDIVGAGPGQNNILPFWESGPGQVSVKIPPGRYTSPSSLAAAITDATNSKLYPLANTYLCEWNTNLDPAINDALFSILKTAGGASFEIRWKTGTDASKGVGVVLGYNVSADDTGQSEYEADTPVYGWPLVTLAAAFGHNLESLAKISIEVRKTTFIGAGLGYGAFFADEMPGNRDVRLATSSFGSWRYWRLIIDDVQNPAGFTEIGVVFLGPYDEYAGWVPGREDEREQLSQVYRTPFGAMFQEVRTEAKRIFGQLRALTRTEKLAFETMQASVKVGGPFVLMASAVNHPTDETYYMALEETVRFTHNPETEEKYDSSSISFVQQVAG